MNDIKEFLENNYGFSKTDWGFLNKTIEGVEYTLLHDAINGYFLQYSFMTARTAALNKIPLGKKPTLDNLYTAFETILRSKN